MNHPRIETLDALFALLAGSGRTLYGGEAVSQLEHALQSAFAAEQDGADAALITAALLHDIGHIACGQADDELAQGINDHHEAVAVQLLCGLFDASVLQPIALHVAAKRYLCATRPDYLASLSEASRLSLALQGGAMSSAECERFTSRPHAAAALALRRYDDIAKVPGLATPPLAHYHRLAANVVISRP
ncbi:phosphonate degradation HD-domain oxygenase [Vogesella sp. LIG4]|uniref:phosphonate degradation HD-domain oxygenase n=1 Tax=Vogesella sp. LIG4 TaxID=1192162 RepID=UPI00081FCA01|nr:phosphonate degradation HD-domain oxygenase [Vogesella sp. LIG4]SCK28380.1 phosphonate degradation operons associated HDIG domain protein [Vogesella sp. LIG4]